MTRASTVPIRREGSEKLHPVRLDRVLREVKRPVGVARGTEYREIGVRSFGRGIFHKDPVLGEDLGEKDVYWIEPGDLVFNIVFAWEGAVAIAGASERGFIGSHRFPTFRTDVDQFDVRYILYYLLSDAGRFLLEDDSPGAAGRNRTLDRRKLLKEWVQVPDLATQRHVADLLDRKLGAVTALSETKERQLWAIQEKGFSLLWSQDRPGPADAHSSIPWMRCVPRDWSTERGRFLFRQVQFPPEDGDGVVTAFRDGQVTLRENRRSDGFTFAVKELGYQRVRAGDLVLHSMDAFAGAVGVSESTGKCSPEYVVLEPSRPGTKNAYFAACIRWMALQGYIQAISPSVRERAPRFRFTAFKDVWLPVPREREQKRIADRLTSYSAAVRTLRRELEVLKEFRQALIDEAIGPVDVRRTSHAASHRAGP